MFHDDVLHRMFTFVNVWKRSFTQNISILVFPFKEPIVVFNGSIVATVNYMLLVPNCLIKRARPYEIIFGTRKIFGVDQICLRNRNKQIGYQLFGETDTAD